jgi:hypothetical protein
MSNRAQRWRVQVIKKALLSLVLKNKKRKNNVYGNTKARKIEKYSPQELTLNY